MNAEYADDGGNDGDVLDRATFHLKWGQDGTIWEVKVVNLRADA